MSVTEITITNRDGLPMRANLHLPEGDGPHPLVLVAHGFKGFKDWGSFPHIAESLAGRGLAALRFNFARNGIGDDPLAFDRLDLFEENSLSRELRDLEDLLEALPDHDATDRDRIGLLGHSRGGGVAVLFAAREPRIR
ncbi:MAG: alpha/beta hydrolase family protein, partial [Planctomycetota bacterium]